MSIFLWICLGLGLLAGLLEAWANNQKKINVTNQQQESDNTTTTNGFNSKKTGIILIIGVAVLGVLAIMGFSNLGSDNIISGNKKYEDIAIQYIEQASSEYLSYMTLVDTSSYSLDKEVRVTLEYRFTEGPNTSYKTYVIAIDKDTNKVVGFSQY